MHSRVCSSELVEDHSSRELGKKSICLLTPDRVRPLHQAFKIEKKPNNVIYSNEDNDFDVLSLVDINKSKRCKFSTNDYFTSLYDRQQPFQVVIKGNCVFHQKFFDKNLNNYNLLFPLSFNLRKKLNKMLIIYVLTFLLFLL